MMTPVRAAFGAVAEAVSMVMGAAFKRVRVALTHSGTPIHRAVRMGR
jgi:hypothetical protein